MSGISMLTVLEIFTNPRDLEVTIVQESKEDGGKYAIFFSRGPGHDFKMLISSEPFTDNFNDAVEMAEGVLNLVIETVTKELENKKSLASRVLNPKGKKVVQTKVLNAEQISKIVEELRKNKIASTHKMFTNMG